MKTNIFYTLVVLLTSLSASADPTLWKIESDKAEVYMFGSIHVGKAEMYPFSKEINSAFINSDNLVLEIDLLSPSMIGAVAWMYLNSSLPNNQTLENIMSETDLKKLQDALKTLKLPYSSVANLKPWLIGMNLQMLMFTNQEYKAELGVDIHFAQRALRHKKKVLQLESASEQFSYFDNLSMEQQVTFLIGSLDQIENGQQMISKMMHYWLEGNQVEFEKLIMADFKGAEDEQFFYDIFLKNRNIKMADKIANYLETGESYFVVVGAAHYIGEDSIIRYLEDKGIKVSKLN